MCEVISRNPRQRILHTPLSDGEEDPSLTLSEHVGRNRPITFAWQPSSSYSHTLWPSPDSYVHGTELTAHTCTLAIVEFQRF